MSIINMNMSSYEVQQVDSRAVDYGDEVLCAGWVPSLALHQSLPQDWENKSAMPANLANVDADLFLRRMYAHQR